MLVSGRHGAYTAVPTPFALGHLKSLLIRLTAACALVVGIAYGTLFVSTSPPASAPFALAVGATGCIMSLMALGAVRRDRLPRVLVVTFIGVFVLCAGAFVVALLLPANEGAGAPLLLGLPVRTAIVLYGVGVVPIAVLPFAYAYTFDASTLSDADLAAVRRVHARTSASPDGARARHDAAL